MNISLKQQKKPTKMKNQNHATLSELNSQINEMEMIVKSSVGPEKELYSKLLTSAKEDVKNGNHK